MSDHERKFESRAVDRLILFSDAVTAIAITLLAIDLPVPAGDSVSELWASVRQNDGHYLAFLISFVAIAAAWSTHHELFRHVERVDPRLRQLDMVWLLTIILIPFATRLLTNRGHETVGAHAVRFGFYALLQVVGSLVLLAMLRHLGARGEAPDTPPQAVEGLARQSYEVALGFGLSIPVFFATTYAWVLWIIAPLALRQLHRRRHARRGDELVEPPSQ